MTDLGERVRLAPERDFPASEFERAGNDISPKTVSASGRPALPHIAVVDSHCLTRESFTNNISYLLENVQVSSFFSVTNCNDHRASLFSLIILNLHASDHSPLELLRSLRSAYHHSMLFLVSNLDYRAEPEFIRAASHLGVRGFISTKTTGLALTVSAIRFVQAGGYFAPVDAMLSMPSRPLEPLPVLAAFSELTARESVVLVFLRDGKTNKAIARELRLSSNTVKVHVHNILRKMQASNRREAALRDASDPGDPAQGRALTLPKPERELATT